MKRIRNIFLLVFVFFTNLLYGELPQSGLYFCSHENNVDKRTSLILNAGEPYHLNKETYFTLDFDIFIRDVEVKFGYIFRIISNKEENIDLVINNDRQTFLVINNQDFLLKTLPPANQWNHIRVSFDKKQNQISLRLNEEETVECACDLNGLKSLLIMFGRVEIGKFTTNDVSPFVLKNVQTGSDRKKLHYWTLDKHEKKGVYDNLKKRLALVHNPHWLMDNRVSWKKVATFRSFIFPQICFDSIHNCVFALTDSGLVNYSLITDQTTLFPNNGLGPRHEYYNRMVYDPVFDRLLYYSFNPCILEYYNFEKKQWSKENYSEEENYAQHNRTISTFDSTLYLFGGYGHYKYTGDFFRVHLKTGAYEKFDFSQAITPRYLSAMGLNPVGDKMYILGGRGAEMGRQELSPQNFSDLYEVDLKTNKVNYLYDLNEEGKTVYSNSLIATNHDSCFYVLAYSNNQYSTNIVLKKIHLSTRKIENLADSIKFYFKDISSFCDLYYSPSLSKLVATVAYSEDQETTQIDIYTLDFPPLRKGDVIQKPPSGTNYRYIILLIIGFFLVIFSCKKQKKQSSTVPDVMDSERTDNSTEVPEKSFYSPHKQSILFLGGFQAFDKAGKNITGDFTPTLKHLLVLIILYTLKNNKGISSSRLQELLWLDKSEESARNNRNVNIRKLRILLRNIGEADVSSNLGYWTITLPDAVFLDYKEALSLIQRIRADKTPDKNDLLRLLEILSFGLLLPNIQFEWIDDIKTDFSNSVIDLLMNIVENTKLPYFEDIEIRLKIADTILGIDPISEDGIAIKCKALYKMRKKGLAKTVFDNFTKEYQSLLGEAYTGSIKNFLN